MNVLVLNLVLSLLLVLLSSWILGIFIKLNKNTKQNSVTKTTINSVITVSTITLILGLISTVVSMYLMFI